MGGWLAIRNAKRRFSLRSSSNLSLLNGGRPLIRVPCRGSLPGGCPGIVGGAGVSSAGSCVVVTGSGVVSVLSGCVDSVGVADGLHVDGDWRRASLPC